MRFPVLAVVLLPLVAGCAAIGPGDYRIFRVAFSEAEQTEDCFPGGENIDDAEDTTTFRAGDTFAIYAGTGGAFFLEFGDDTLEGVKSGGLLTFEGVTVDLEYFGGSDENVTTNTQTTTITMDAGGASVTGTFTSSVDQICSGAGCSDANTFSCSGSNQFIGTRVNAVDLEHQL